MDSKTSRAFEAMEGEAVPFLIRVLEKTGPSRPEKWYEAGYKRLPGSLTISLPKPHTSATYRQRRIQAILLLGVVGEAQSRKLCEEGRPSSKPSITNAFPALRVALKDPDANIRMLVPYAITGFGPLAAPLVPELLEIVANEHPSNSPNAMEALGSMGRQASNAVPALIQVLADRRRKDRPSAARALGQIGVRAQKAASVLVQVMNESDWTLAAAALRALAEIGDTPVEAVPALTALKERPEAEIRALACLALWNRDRQNTNLYEEIIATIHSSLNLELARTFRVLGTNAAPFAVELERAMVGKYDDKEVRSVMKSIRSPGP